MSLKSGFAHLDESNILSWDELFSFLLAIARSWVRSSAVSAWRGQEDEVAEDIVLEAISRTWKYSQRGDVSPIVSLKRLSIVIARNYFEDIRRKELRFVHLAQEDFQSVLVTVDNPAPCVEVDITEKLIEDEFEKLFSVTVVDVIVKIPKKQRKALLVDLANLTFCDDQPTALQQAFLDAGIRLEDYQQPISDKPRERSRHAANLSLAYKRLKKQLRDSELALVG